MQTTVDLKEYYKKDNQKLAERFPKYARLFKQYNT